MPVAKNQPLERFNAKILIDPISGCWEWIASKDAGGYGVFWCSGRNNRAHRWAWEQINGPVPNGMVLDHFVCDNPSCANPYHVRPATVRENILRGNAPTSRYASQDACPRCNTEYIVEPSGSRRCPACMKAYKAEWYQKNKRRPDACSKEPTQHP